MKTKPAAQPPKNPARTRRSRTPRWLWSAVTCHRFLKATCRRRTAVTVRPEKGRSPLAPAQTCPRVRSRTEIRRRQVACAKAVTNHRTPNFRVPKNSFFSVPTSFFRLNFPSLLLGLLPISPLLLDTAGTVLTQGHRLTATTTDGVGLALTNPHGQPVRLRLEMQHAKVFSFTFAP